MKKQISQLKSQILENYCKALKVDYQGVQCGIKKPLMGTLPINFPRPFSQSRHISYKYIVINISMMVNQSVVIKRNNKKMQAVLPNLNRFNISK